MAKCGQHGCSCNTCENCGEYHEQCKCELLEDTKRFLEATDYTYEDRAHSGEYLLQRWYSRG